MKTSRTLAQRRSICDGTRGRSARRGVQLLCSAKECCSTTDALCPQIEAVELEMARTREAIASMKADIAKNDGTVKDLLAAIMNGGGGGR